MNETVIVAIISLFGTLFGSIAGIVASGKLTAFRLSSLEKKMDEYSKFFHKIPIMEKEQQNFAFRISALENRVENRSIPS